ncbi:ABC transporter permease [Amycolatopsis pigmentata]|uniref:ABC transporter permease n=1 Tax=Amycolatopsis pigmentata TaxID=450801 RepID=A0ABW5FNF0_9PSEU
MPQWVVWGVLVVLVVGPLLPLLLASLRSKPYYLPGGTFTLHAYQQLFTDPDFWIAVENTVLFAVLTTALAVTAGTVFAILCGRTNMPGRKVYGVLLVAPVVIPPLGLIVGWVSVYGQSGYLTGLVASLHLPVWNLSSIPGMAVLGAAVTTPIAFLTCQSALAGSDTALEDAARSAGAGALQAITRITVPLLRPAILNCGVLIFTLSLEVLGIPLFLGQPSHINLYATYLYRAWNNSGVPDPPFVSAGAVLLLVVVTALLLLRTRLAGAEQRFIATSPRGGIGYQPLDLRGWRRPLAVLVGLFITVTSAVPLVGLVVMSSVKALTTLVAPWDLLTGGNWRQLVTDSTVRRAIMDSLLIGTLGGAVTVALVAVATLIAHRSGFPLRRTIAPLLAYPRAVPGIILGIGFFWSYLMVEPGPYVRNNIWGEMIVLSVRNITLAYVVIYPSLARINEELDRAARATGAGWWTTAGRVLLPILRPSLVAAFLLVFVSILNDYDPVVFLQKPGTEVIGVTMLQFWQKGALGPVAALAVVQIIVVGVVLAIGARVIRKGRHA